MKFQTISYMALGANLKKKHKEFKSDKQLNKYIDKHPEILLQSLTRMMPLNKALLAGVYFLVPELRTYKHVVSSCKFTNLLLSSNVKFTFYIMHANYRNFKYWMNLKNSLQHTNIIPFYYHTLILRRLKPRVYKFLERLHQNNGQIKLLYVNKINRHEYKQLTKLCEQKDYTHKTDTKINLRDMIKCNQVKKIKSYPFIFTNLYEINHKKYIIQSKQLDDAMEKRVNNKNERAKK